MLEEAPAERRLGAWADLGGELSEEPPVSWLALSRKEA